jgi:hypothetical protein
MRQFDLSGWRLALESNQATHLVLYVRDACQLTPTGYNVPPPLLGHIDPIELGLSPDEQSKASAEWLQWWLRIVHARGQSQLDFSKERADAQVQPTYVPKPHEFDPFEGFKSLEKTPLLRDAAIRTWRSGAEWSKEYQSREVGHRNELVRSAAESTIQKHHVGPEFVRACVFVLSVEGNWSCLTEPGVLLCSVDTYKNDRQFALELEVAFAAGLTRPLD